MLDNMSIEINQVSVERHAISSVARFRRLIPARLLCLAQVKKIKDDIEYYIESSQDADFQENEYLYDDIEGIDEVELTGIAVTGSANTDSNGTPTSLTSSPAHASPLLQQQQQSVLAPTQPPQPPQQPQAPSQPQPPQSHSADTTTSTVLSTEEKKKEKLSQSTPTTTNSNVSAVGWCNVHRVGHRFFVHT